MNALMQLRVALTDFRPTGVSNITEIDPAYTK